MANRRLIAAALGAVVAGAVVAGIALTRGDDKRAPRRPARVVVQPPVRLWNGVGATSFFDHPALLFGDPVGAHLELVVDRRYADPRRVQVAVRFEPYRLMRPVATERFASGHFVWLEYHYRVLCLRRACRPRPTRHRTFRFEPAQIVFRRTDGTRRTLQKRWPPLVVASRLKRDDLLRGGFRARAHPLPAISYRVSPGRLSLGLAVAAFVAALAGLALIVGALWPIVRARVLRARALGELERELALLLESLGEGEPEQRRALDRFARILRRSGADDLAGDARHLAWSEGAPASSDVLELAAQAERQAEPGA